MAKPVKQLLAEKAAGIGARTNFESYWQTLHDFFDNSGMDVNTTYYPGTELTVSQLYDTYSLEAADVLAAGLSNYLTPSASRWFGLRTKDPLKMESKAVMRYLKDIETEITHALNNSNFYNVMPEFYKKSGVYGTSVLFQEEDEKDKIRFYSLPMKAVVIANDSRGRAAEYWIEFEYTAEQAVDRFQEKVHPDVLKQANEKRDPDKKYIYTLYIGPNWNRNPKSKDNKNKPYISQWLDDAHQTEIDRGGFDELPALTHRFYERATMPWGFSPAMKALTDVRMLNAIAKTQIRSMMKHTDPAVAMPDNAFLSPYNGNPRGVNYYKKGVSADDIFAIGNYGNPAVGDEALRYSKERIASQMFTDVFRTFDGVTKQMNNPEVFERITEKMTLLGPAVGRFMNVLDDTINRTMGILYRQGRLPEPPEEMVGDPSYEIEYLSVLAKAQRNPELQSMQNALQIVAGMASFSPEVMDKINPDQGVDAVWGITGAPVQMLRDDDEVEAIREARAEAEQAQQQAEMMGMGADVSLKATQAGKNVAEAQAIGGGV